MKSGILFSVSLFLLGMSIFGSRQGAHSLFEKSTKEVTQECLHSSDSLKLSSTCQTFVQHVKWQSTQDVTYDPSYFTIPYPNGDVPANKGVCVDVPIRGLRSIGIDLQRLVHEDILAARSAYQINKVDKNIDHRRCTNLIVYFKRQKQTVPVTTEEKDYQPGDIVFWDIARGHVGVVTDEKVPGTNRYFMVHNICCGPKMEDFLFAAPIVCHVRFEKLR